VSDVFDAIKYRSYIPGAPPPPRNSVPAAPVTAPRGPASSNFGISDIARGPQNGSRKRPYNESGGGDFQDHGDYQTGVDMNRRAFKQPKRGGNIGRGGRNDPFGNFRDDQQQQTPLNISGVPLPGFPNMSGMSNQSPGMPPIDPNNPMATFLAMQAMGFPGLPQLPQGMTPGGGAGSPASGFPQGQRSRRCRDYDTKGFCARGNSCKFEHGNDSIYVPPAQVDGEYPVFNAQFTLGFLYPMPCNNFRLRPCL
jgi:RNA-binding protein 26